MNYLSEERGMLAEYGRRGAEEKRTSIDRLLGVENSLKSLRGLQRALGDPAPMARKSAEEQDLRRRVDADPALKAMAGGAWDAITRAMDDRRPLLVPYWLIEEEQGFHCTLFDFARTLVRSAEELAKPAGKRLPEFEEAQLSALKQGLFDPAPVHKDVEILTLAFSLTKLREELGADDPFVRMLLGPLSPRELAESAVKGSRLDDASVRTSLFTGGAAAVEASQDPMIRLARRVDPEARAIRRKYEDTVSAIVAKNHESIAKARFALFGKGSPPDATFSPVFPTEPCAGGPRAGAPWPLSRRSEGCSNGRRDASRSSCLDHG